MKTILALVMTLCLISCGTFETVSKDANKQLGAVQLTEAEPVRRKCPLWLDPILPDDIVIVTLDKALKEYQASGDLESAKAIQKFKLAVLNADEDYLHNCLSP